MKIIVCLDEKGGMLFNNRRQSSDRIIRQDMLQMLGEQKLYVNAYTAKQFAEEEMDKLVVDEECLEKAETDDLVFVENIHVGEHVSKVEQVIVYRWERTYPADFFFDIDLASKEWMLLTEQEFAGHSHEVIWKEIYVRAEGETTNETM